MHPFEAGFQDLEFEHALVWRRSPLEGLSRRWEPIGMPRLGPNLKDTVFFLYGRNTKTGEIDEAPSGSGVFVGLVSGSGRGYLRHAYAVTAHHVIADASMIRLNTQDGGSRFIEIEPHEWQFDAKCDELAAVDVTERQQVGDSLFSIPELLFADEGFFRNVEFGIGEDGFMLGLFTGHAGHKHNAVAARFGNVSLLADESAPIEQPNGNLRPSFVFDMHSRPGFSGSPVFVYRTPAGDLRDIAFGPNRNVPLGASTPMWAQDTEDWSKQFEERRNTFLRLLGIHVGQYPDIVEARKVGKVEPETDKLIRDRDQLKIPSSMTVVAPAWEIKRLLDLPIFQNQRNIREQQDEKLMGTKPEPETTKEDRAGLSAQRPDRESATKADNPSHKEDFTALVTAAARKKKRDD